MSKWYSQQDILEMAVKKREQDLAADVDGDGKITPEDARLAKGGVEVPDPSMSMSQSILDRLMNTPEYGYDYDADPLYRQYKEMYENAGSRAAENAYGLASAYTGGYGSSYAATAANDAYALYMDKLAAKGAELEQKAYDRYNDSRADLYKQLDTARSFEDRKYDREVKEDERRYDRQTDAAERKYRQERDAKDDAYRDREQDRKDRELERDAANDLISFAFNAAGKGDYSYLAALGVDTSSLTEKDALAAAETYAKYGDLSALAKLGVDVSPLEEKNAMEKAAWYANYGDYSRLADLGVDLTSLNRQNKLDEAAFYAKYGDLSGLSKLGVDVSQLKREQLYDIAALFAKYGNYSLLYMLL